MSGYLGDFPTSAVVYDLFGSFAAATGAPSATTNFAAGDVLIYKDGGSTPRASSAGITVTTGFNSVMGLQAVAIDTSDNTTANFYQAGHEYSVAIGPITVDGQTLNFPAFSFSIERAGAALALIKGGSITVGTATNLTNAPTAGDLTATMKTSVAQSVLNATQASYVAAGSVGKSISDASSASAGAVWDVVNASHLAAGSTGAALNAASGGAVTAGSSVAFIGMIADFNRALTLTPSDTNNLEQATDAIYVGGAGNVVVVQQGGSTVTWAAVAGQFIPTKAIRVNATLTTATGLLALYQV